MSFLTYHPVTKYYSLMITLLKRQGHNVPDPFECDEEAVSNMVAVYDKYLLLNGELSRSISREVKNIYLRYPTHDHHLNVS